MTLPNAQKVWDFGFAHKLLRLNMIAQTIAHAELSSRTIADLFVVGIKG